MKDQDGIGMHGGKRRKEKLGDLLEEITMKGGKGVLQSWKTKTGKPKGKQVSLLIELTSATEKLW